MWTGDWSVWALILISACLQIEATHGSRQFISRKLDYVKKTLSLANFFVSSTEQAKNVLLGTKWCGPADRAFDNDDLGQLWRLDSCCRDHDNCPMSSNSIYGEKRRTVTM